MNNPYLKELKDKFKWEENDFFEDIKGFKDPPDNNLSKWDLRLKYAFGIPDQKAIDELVNLSPLVEIGAGSGYWAYLIDKNGGDIIAFDNFDRKDQFEKEWFNVMKGTPEKLEKYPDRNLFLCWPENDDPMGELAVKKSQSNKVITIGEGKNGCTGNDGMHYILNKDYTLEEIIEIPTWFNNNDSMFIYNKD